MNSDSANYDKTICLPHDAVTVTKRPVTKTDEIRRLRIDIITVVTNSTSALKSTDNKETETTAPRNNS